MLKEEIIKILESGEGVSEKADNLVMLIQSITDPENQPNQYGIKL